MSAVSDKRVVLSVNQDKGIGPERAKGAAVHLTAMRKAFAELGADCRAVDEADDERLLSNLNQHLESGSIDLIYERYALGKSTAARFSKQHSIPLILEVNAPLADEQTRWRGGSDESEDLRQDRISFRTAVRVLAVSNEVARYAMTRGAAADQIEICPNGIDTQRFNLATRATSKRQELIPDGRFVIGFHGRLRPWHGFDMLVDVCNDLLAGGFDVHLLVVGEGEFNALQKLPEDRYTRIPWQAHKEIPKYVAAFDVLPLTYQADMPCYFSPLKLAEAMACGVVPLVPDLGDLPEAVRHNHTGLVYTAGDKRQLQTQLQSLINDKDLLKNLAGQAASEARQKSWTRIAALALEFGGLPVSLLQSARQQLQLHIADLQQVRRVAIEKQGDIYFEVHTRHGQQFFVFQNRQLSELKPGNDAKIPLAKKLADSLFASKHRIVSYRPGRRLVLASSRDAQRVFLKGYKKRRSGAAMERFRIASAVKKSGGFDVPAVLSYEQDDDCLVLAELSGQAPEINIDAADNWQEIGAQLRHFQQSNPAGELQVFTWQQELEVLDERARRFLLCVPQLPPHWVAGRALLSECSKRLPPVDWGLAHRDLHDGQFVIDGATVGLLDFDLLSRADVALDAGNLLAHLHLRGLQQGTTAAVAASEVCSQAFQQGLDRQQEPGYAHRVLFYQASTLMRLALLYTIRPRWDHLVAELIEEGNRCATKFLEQQEHCS